LRAWRNGRSGYPSPVLGHARRWFGIESGLASMSAVLAVVTLFWADWLEVTGWKPDHVDGSVEWMIAAALLLVAVVLGGLASARARSEP
jgi:hypothetical protein